MIDRWVLAITVGLIAFAEVPAVVPSGFQAISAAARVAGQRVAGEGDKTRPASDQTQQVRVRDCAPRGRAMLKAAGLVAEEFQSVIGLSPIIAVHWPKSPYCVLFNFGTGR